MQKFQTLVKMKKQIFFPVFSSKILKSFICFKQFIKRSKTDRCYSSLVVSSLLYFLWLWMSIKMDKMLSKWE